MDARTKETLFTSVVVLSLLLLTIHAEGAAPSPHYNAALAISAMLASVLSYSGVEKMSRFAAVNKQFSANGPTGKLFDLREVAVIVVLVLLTGLETSIFVKSGFARVSMGVANFTFGVNLVFLPLFTSVLLGAVNVSEYFDSLVTTRSEPLGEGLKNPIIPQGAEVRAHVPQSRVHVVAGVLGAFFMSLFIAVLPLANPALGVMLFGIARYPAYISVVVLISTLAAGYCFFGAVVNRQLALCGMRRERDLLGGLRRDEEAFEAQRLFAHRARNTAIVFAVVIYPLTFYVFYAMLGL